MAKQLEDRIADLEKKTAGGGGKFFFQYLFSPLAVVVLGGGFTYMINREQRDLQHLQLAQTMMSALFSPDRYQALATKRLLDEVITDAALRASLGEIVENYFNSQIDAALARDDLPGAQSVFDAAAAIGGTSGGQIATAATGEKLAKYEEARPHEVAALTAISENRFDDAVAEIKSAQTISPGLPPVRDLSQLLQSKEGNLGDPRAQAEIKDEILRNLSTRVPPSVLQDLRTSRSHGQ